ncbi:MAG: glycosyltransferase [Candidatus Omnitrophica bacterium]|nr:glycosyltransferase [Candidatus Omnitrophota bacterium]
MTANLLKFSFSIPVFNSARYLDGCLKSIRNQSYPQDLVELLVVDAGSTDDTIEIAKKYNARIFRNPKRLGEYGMKIAVANATGDLLVMFAADNGLAQKDWLAKVAEIYLTHQDLAALWGRMIASKDDASIMRYYELIQSEPLAYFINKNLHYYLETARKEKLNDLENYYLFNVQKERPICWGANGLVYRLQYVKDIFAREGYIGDNEIFQYMVEKGHNLVAYSFDLNIYHHTVVSVWDWVKKWKRNFVNIFLETRNQRRIDWFYYGNFKLKLFFWLIYSLIPIFSIVHSVYLVIRNRNIYWLYHPLVSFLQTITYVFWALRLPKGRLWFKEQILGRGILS